MQSQDPLRENEAGPQRAAAAESSASWQYRQPGTLNGRRFSGFAHVATGCEASCIHAELTDAMYQLLVWASTARQTDSKRPAESGAGNAA
ncbi:hypothetical protein GCM10023080_074390 [Streptomyces pseudoechinosporeus]